ncbi:MAG TPA: 16S rRNA (uracil(1498)-N(3))-methyltransferase [Cytophagales bacterium]|nr:16S rRNA (uracil(1498)-N(3))-methyltransferase [Cytophagales bacterium]HAA17611.1 16S rRNA (uracil(1498)-N(3))-methyltransferase [Cytophagales bacterium]HAP63970.1 16S rRNA (uracil(1498)-N(3))-methyltransferase [Cytophagales bacterium]
MQLFYLPQLPESGVLDAEEANHATKVLRKRVGDELWATDGRGTRYRTRLVEAQAKRAEVEIVEKMPSTKSRPWLHLVIAPTKNLDRMEWMVEKAVELGVAEIHFILTEHSERKVLKLERLQRKAISAMKQSLKDWAPTLFPLTPWTDWLDTHQETGGFIAHLEGDNTPHLFNALTANLSSWVLIGPEGGFSDGEIAAALSKDMKPVSLGSERLRTETAGLAAAQLVALKNELDIL